MLPLNDSPIFINSSLAFRKRSIDSCDCCRVLMTLLQGTDWANDNPTSVCLVRGKLQARRGLGHHMRSYRLEEESGKLLQWRHKFHANKVFLVVTGLSGPNYTSADSFPAFEFQHDWTVSGH